MGRSPRRALLQDLGHEVGQARDLARVGGFAGAHDELHVRDRQRMVLDDVHLKPVAQPLALHARERNVAGRAGGGRRLLGLCTNGRRGLGRCRGRGGRWRRGRPRRGGGGGHPQMNT